MKKQLVSFLKAKELDGLCLGYANGHPGSGLGEKYATAIMNNALELYENFKDGDTIAFSLLHLLTEGIGADYIGDITAQIIKEQIYKYTEMQAKEMQIPTEIFKDLIIGKVFSLPVHPNPFKKRIPILFVPKSILSSLPVDANLEYVFNGYISDNDNIRNTTNFKNIHLKEYQQNALEILQEKENMIIYLRYSYSNIFNAKILINLFL